ncbi:MAG: hypothetical protein KZQ76_12245 [Candidatus Thiodiazotropha sp. (ex Epidulcina cf. delphinae)]|nr:hypothetical protein [Candidatus Thiodiazotropha sp. (ex Epidulcina cf. delphinae)]
MLRSKPTTRYRMIWLIPALMLTFSSGLAATSPSAIMSKTMLAMMDTMGELAHQFKGDSRWEFGNNAYPDYGRQDIGGYPRNPYGSPAAGGRPTRRHAPFPPSIPHPSRYRSAVDGIWIGQAGEIVLVMYGRFRVYASTDIYRDGRYRIKGNRLIMFDLETKTALEYEYRLNRGRMIMRHESGSILLFKRLPIPIPPYSLFSRG